MSKVAKFNKSAYLGRNPVVSSNSKNVTIFSKPVVTANGFVDDLTLAPKQPSLT